MNGDVNENGLQDKDEQEQEEEEEEEEEEMVQEVEKEGRQGDFARERKSSERNYRRGPTEWSLKSSSAPTSIVDLGFAD